MNYGKITKTQKGFTLLLAVLISSILIAVGSAIFDIALKEITLSSSGRESQFAFYSADTGVECALYWDLKQNAFGTTSPQNSIKCGGVTIPDATWAPGAGWSRTLNNPNAQDSSYSYVTKFWFPVLPTTDPTSKVPCTYVKVTRLYYPVITTTVESSGYNTCDTGNVLRLERTIRVTY